MHKHIQAMPIKLRAISFMALCVICIYISGELSRAIAYFALNNGTNFAFKDILNAALIIFCGYYFVLPRKSLPKISDFSLIGIGVGILIAIALVFGAWLIAYFAKAMILTPKANNIDYSQIIFSLFLLILHGFSEEYLSQNYLRKFLNANLGRINAILLTACIFPIVQFLQGYHGALFLLEGYLIGLIFTLLAQKYSYMAAVFAHGVWSWLELSLLPEILSIRQNGQNIWINNGDTYGSVSLLIILVALLFALSLFEVFGYKNAHDKK